MRSDSATTYIPKALLRRRHRPLVIWAAPPLLAILGVYNALFAILVAIESNDASIVVAEAAVSASHARWIVAPALLTVSGTMFALAYGFAAGRPWTRAFVTHGVPVAYATTVMLLVFVSGGLFNVLVATLPDLVFVLAAVWYFGRSSAIRTYYQTLGA